MSALSTSCLLSAQVRLDSFAKFLAPGLRLGWVTAAAPLVEKLTFCIHGSSLGACATTQASCSSTFNFYLNLYLNLPTPNPYAYPHSCKPYCGDKEVSMKTTTDSLLLPLRWVNAGRTACQCRLGPDATGWAVKQGRPVHSTFGIKKLCVLQRVRALFQQVACHRFAARRLRCVLSGAGQGDDRRLGSRRTRAAHAHDAKGVRAPRAGRARCRRCAIENLTRGGG